MTARINLDSIRQLPVLSSFHHPPLPNACAALCLGELREQAQTALRGPILRKQDDPGRIRTEAGTGEFARSNMGSRIGRSTTS
jgi:hypothetical protein